MSTFDGHIAEFPDISIEHFRSQLSPGSRPPLAFFLSHVHTDHTVGLESCKGPFIYCSPATRDILLRLEKFPHRMNFSKGILETRTQHFRHLNKVLKAIPLETPTEIELAPGRVIRATLFDANHCIGAVMLLLEADSKAILYTGDIRSEAWWVNSLTRNPLLIPYVDTPGSPPIKKLDNVYLDTTFIVNGRENPYREFPSKAEGVAELLRKVSRCPKDTVFYFDSWTFGYEEVWQALSNFLGERIHVDQYRYKLYASLTSGAEPRAQDIPKLTGYWLGNHKRHGILTTDVTRLHSCEQGTGCEVFQKDFVRITPIITRYGGVEHMEAGSGGGQGDLDQQNELDVGDAGLLVRLLMLCQVKLQDRPHLLDKVTQLLQTHGHEGAQTLSLAGPAFLDAVRVSAADDNENGEISIERLVPVLMELAAKAEKSPIENPGPCPTKTTVTANGAPKQITFPYSRHSSYSELCLLIDAFKPRDIYPCTVVQAGWSRKASMSYLFGHLYEGITSFTHDEKMLNKLAKARAVTAGRASEQESNGPNSDRRKRKRSVDDEGSQVLPDDENRGPVPSRPSLKRNISSAAQILSSARTSDPLSSATHVTTAASLDTNERHRIDLGLTRRLFRQEAYDAALGDGSDWAKIGLISTGTIHLIEEEL